MREHTALAQVQRETGGLRFRQVLHEPRGQAGPQPDLLRLGCVRRAGDRRRHPVQSEIGGRMVARYHPLHYAQRQDAVRRRESTETSQGSNVTQLGVQIARPRYRLHAGQEHCPADPRARHHPQADSREGAKSRVDESEEGRNELTRRKACPFSAAESYSGYNIILVIILEALYNQKRK